MKREIKFRVWDQLLKEMITHELLLVDQRCGPLTYAELVSVESQGAVLMQFAGLYDKNGREIYEGDVLRVKYDDDLPKPYREVKFYDGAFVAAVIGNFGEVHPWPLRLAITLNGEVIGNIYEHSHLMESP